MNENLYKTTHYFMRNISSDFLDLPHATAYKTNIQAAHFNPVCIKSKVAVSDTLFTQCQKFHEENSKNFSLVVPVIFCSQEIIDFLTNHEFELADTSLDMFLEMDSFEIIQLDPDIRLTSQNLNDWILPLTEAFESTPEIGHAYTRAHTHALKKGASFYHFSLYEHNQPVSSVTLSIHDRLARIDDLGTLPSFHRKGYGTRLFLHALSYAKQKQATHCFLNASKMGEGMYKKKGFKTLISQNIYMPSK